jgi:hypothetical protein
LKLSDYLNAINYTKPRPDEFDEHPPFKGYSPYVINKSLSFTADTIFQANEVNSRHHLSKEMQYDYLRHSVRKRKRFSPWLRKVHPDCFDKVQVYYGYSKKKTEEALSVLTEGQIQEICSSNPHGGDSEYS